MPIGAFILIPSTRQLFLGEAFYKKLTWKECQVLEMLIESFSSGEIMDREKVLLKVWLHVNRSNHRSMDVYITRLRKYLSADPNIEIINYHGKGHKLLVNTK